MGKWGEERPPDAFRFPYTWLLHNRYTRGMGGGRCDRAGSRGCIKVRLSYSPSIVAVIYYAADRSSPSRLPSRCFFVYWNAAATLLSPGFLIHSAPALSLHSFERKVIWIFHESFARRLIPRNFSEEFLNRSGSRHMTRYSRPCRLSYETRLVSRLRSIDLLQIILPRRIIISN